jgi:hypothetical protein
VEGSTILRLMGRPEAFGVRVNGTDEILLLAWSIVARGNSPFDGIAEPLVGNEPAHLVGACFTKSSTVARFRNLIWISSLRS